MCRAASLTVCNKRGGREGRRERDEGEWESGGKGIKRDNAEVLSSYSGERRGGGRRDRVTRAWWQTETIPVVLVILIKQGGVLLIVFYLCFTQLLSSEENMIIRMQHGDCYEA